MRVLRGKYSAILFMLVGVIWSWEIYIRGGEAGIQNFCYFWTGYATLGLLLMAALNISVIRKGYKESIYPSIAFSFELVDGSKVNGPIVLRVRNNGKTSAKNLKIEPASKSRNFFSHPEGSIDEDSVYNIKNTLLFTSGIKNFSPDQCFNYYFADSVLQLASKITEKNAHDFTHSFLVSYITYDGKNISYTDSVSLIDSLGITALEDPLVNAVNDIRSAIDKTNEIAIEANKNSVEQSDKMIKYLSPTARRKLISYVHSRRRIDGQIKACKGNAEVLRKFAPHLASDAEESLRQANSLHQLKYHPIKKISMTVKKALTKQHR